MQERIYQLRKRAGLSQEDLAEVIGVSRQAVQKWESGSASPDVANLAALCDYFGVTMDYLARGEEAPAQEAEAWTPEARPMPVRCGEYEYVSEATLLGLPLVHIHLGFGLRKAKGIIAIGNVAVGGVAIGGLSLGVLSLGGLAVGGLALGGLSAGLVVFGGIAISLLFSLGGVAVSCGYAIGGLAAAVKGAFGGLAVSSRIAVGERAFGGLALETQKMNAMGVKETMALVRAAYPDTREWVLRLVRLLIRVE